MNVDIDPRDIEKAIVDAVLKSSLGNAIMDAVDTEVASLTKSKNYGQSLIRTAIQAEIQKIVLSVLRNDYEDKIRQVILLFTGLQLY